MTEENRITVRYPPLFYIIPLLTDVFPPFRCIRYTLRCRRISVRRLSRMFLNTTPYAISFTSHIIHAASRMQHQVSPTVLGVIMLLYHYVCATVHVCVSEWRLLHKYMPTCRDCHFKLGRRATSMRPFRNPMFNALDSPIIFVPTLLSYRPYRWVVKWWRGWQV